ncbi:MAG TPA: sigma-70 family RNA polymerase sigma factor [Dehalococcoidia bacterium]|nr:sigma-70 family RNA polymerase sigma factor [Dehalococcoidia bacterium]
MPLDGLSDQSLMLGVTHHDEHALRLLYDRYSALVFTLALRKLGDRGLAEEVLQDVFFRCWSQAQSYRADAGSVASWLFGITRNRCIDVRRSRQAQARARERDALPSPDTLNEPGLPDDAEVVALQLTVRDALAALSEPQRQAIALAYYGDLSQSEIARRLGEPLGTVKTRMRAAMERLRRALILPEQQGPGAKVADRRD